ncbi:MAG: hypothetical protein P8I80_08865, partial [Bacteroidales bacterium]|nr:hypothetical protein [Bacteroidales bacterium]
ITLIPFSAISQSSPPPPPSAHGESGNQSAGGGAPIGGGLFILLGLGAAYGGKKLYDMKKEDLEE